MTSRALVLFSGGQDSTVALAWALERFDAVETVGFDYGQRHRVELDCRPVVLDALRSAGLSVQMHAAGAGGGASLKAQFKKADATGFFGTVIISPKRHGYETAMSMYNWIADGKEPEKVTLTSGSLALRGDYEKVRKDLGIE